jgi:hypothetical protein
MGGHVKEFDDPPHLVDGDLHALSLPVALAPFRVIVTILLRRVDRRVESPEIGVGIRIKPSAIIAGAASVTGVGRRLAQARLCHAQGELYLASTASRREQQRLGQRFRSES